MNMQFDTKLCPKYTWIFYVNIVWKLTVANIVTMQNLEIISNSLIVYKICTE